MYMIELWTSNFESSTFNLQNALHQQFHSSLKMARCIIARISCRMPTIKKMRNQLFESFRVPSIATTSWVHLTRRRKDSKKPSRSSILEGAGVPCSRGICHTAVSGEIILCLEPFEFIAKQRSPEASWFHIKQLTEPLGIIPVSSSLQDR